jgi:hypothetical protein
LFNSSRISGRSSIIKRPIIPFRPRRIGHGGAFTCMGAMLDQRAPRIKRRAPALKLGWT